ncbi:MAG: hypothetical protein QXZ31_05645 [Thermofilaceae archaeon]
MITRVWVKKGGEVFIEGVGYRGEACLRDLEALLERLRQYGVTVDVKEVEKKPEALLDGEEGDALRA